MRFNSLQSSKDSYDIKTSSYILDPFTSNDKYQEVINNYQNLFKREKVKNICFSKEGFFSFFLSLKDKIAVSLGESEYIVQGAKKAKEYGAKIEFLPLKKDGNLDITKLDDSFDFVFISSYIIDTYLKVNLEQIKEKTKAKIISNATVEFNCLSDIYILDSYKLCSLGGMGVLIYEDEFENDTISQINLLALDLSYNSLINKKIDNSSKNKFLNEFKKQFNNELYFFIDPKDTLEHTLHLGLKDIKMRELIQTIAFENIYLSNGERCSLGLSKPSRIIEQMGYSTEQSRIALCLDFTENINQENIKKIVNIIFKKYKQIKALK